MFVFVFLGGEPKEHHELCVFLRFEATPGIRFLVGPRRPSGVVRGYQKTLKFARPPKSQMNFICFLLDAFNDLCESYVEVLILFLVEQCAVCASTLAMPLVHLLLRFA